MVTGRLRSSGCRASKAWAKALVMEMILCLLLTGRGQSQEKPAADFVKAENERYELYAPSEKDLKPAGEEVEYAYQTFLKYFGEAPPKIAVVVFPSPEKMRAYDFSSFRERGLRYLPWVTRDYLAGGATNVRSFSELGLVLSGAGPDGGVRVLTVLPIGMAERDEFHSGDVIRFIDGAPVESLAHFAERYQALPVGAKVKMEVERDGQKRAVGFSKPNPQGAPQSLVQLGGSGEGQRRRDARPLSHEAGHIFFSAYVDRKLGRKSPAESKQTGGDQYGHPQIPDWLDEAVATLCEFPALQKARLLYLHGALDAHIPLGEFFTMEHPVLKSQEELVRQAREQMLAEGRTSTMITISGGPEIAGEQARMFYAEALSLAQFLADREGPAFLAQVADALMHGKKMKDVLAGAKSIPTKISDLEKAWLESVKANHP